MSDNKVAELVRLIDDAPNLELDLCAFVSDVQCRNAIVEKLPVQGYDGYIAANAYLLRSLIFVDEQPTVDEFKFLCQSEANRNHEKIVGYFLRKLGERCSGHMPCER